METLSPFKKASKTQAKAKIALTGPSGSGKTLSALLIAKGLGGKCCVIDTENGSASLYAGHRLLHGFEYDVAEITPPYDVKKYLLLIEEAHKAKYDTLIIDSLTHAWAGEGGMLQKKEALDSRGGNSFSNWGAITKEYEKLKSYLLHSKVNVVVTMRSKQEYILEQTDKGKQAPKKVGLAPIMRDGMEYEFTVVFDIGMDHQFMASKDRTDLFDGVVATITEDTGKQLREWLTKPVTPPPEPPKPEHTPENEVQEAPPDEPQTMPAHENETQEQRRPAGKKPAAPSSKQARAQAKAQDDVWEYTVPIDFEGLQFEGEAVKVAGKKLKELPEKVILGIAGEVHKLMHQAPPPKNIGQLFEVNAKVRTFLKGVGVEL